MLSDVQKQRNSNVVTPHGSAGTTSGLQLFSSSRETPGSIGERSPTDWHLAPPATLRQEHWTVLLIDTGAEISAVSS